MDVVKLRSWGLYKRTPEYANDHPPLIKTIYNAPISVNRKPKAIAFDLDETLGSFADLYELWITLELPAKTQFTFNQLLDLYPEFLRVDILSILGFIRTKIESGQCLPIYIYTNNQCEDLNWVEQIVIYLELRAPGSPVKIFARPICAYKINNRRVDPTRTTHNKTYQDFVKCSMLTHTDLCFVDDQWHPKMKHRRVYYIQPPPYFHGMKRKYIVNRFLESNISKLCDPYLVSRLYSFDSDKIHPDAATTVKLKQEQEISNRMMYYIREFFFVSLRRCSTKKRRESIGGFTRKKR